MVRKYLFLFDFFMTKATALHPALVQGLRRGVRASHTCSPTLYTITFLYLACDGQN
jgi:hypothetical protein